jgi:hypothetical protein
MAERELSIAEANTRGAAMRFEKSGGLLHREIILNYAGAVPPDRASDRRPAWEEESAAQKEIDWWKLHKNHDVERTPRGIEIQHGRKGAEEFVSATAFSCG